VVGRFSGKVAIVTGAASGIGAATARRLAAEGAHVVVADIQDDFGKAISSDISMKLGNATYQRCDVASLADWQRLGEQTQAQFGRMDIVVNNAYTLVEGPAHELAETDWDRQIDVCLKQVYLSARVCMPRLQAARGAMVNVSSVHALVGRHGHPAYVAAKGAICALTRQLAVEYGPRVRVNAVLPGAIDTPATVFTPEARAEFEQHIVARRLGTADEVAAAICFLASGDASYVTGIMLVVDGGWSITKE
jgi:NAD(P)-dependent dehydrogenase (short-subunit alcohol dehydrogenase family)